MSFSAYPLRLSEIIANNSHWVLTRYRAFSMHYFDYFFQHFYEVGRIMLSLQAPLLSFPWPSVGNPVTGQTNSSCGFSKR